MEGDRVLSILLAIITGGGITALFNYLNGRRGLKLEEQRIEDAVWTRLNEGLMQRIEALSGLTQFLEERIRRQESHIRALESALESAQRELREVCTQRDALEQKNAILEERVRLLEAQAGLTPSPV